MIEPTKQWTTQDLELFHDGEMEEAQRTRMSEDLRRDPALRQRYAAIRRVDDVARTALTTEEYEGQQRARRVFRSGVSVAVAAGLLVAVSVIWWFAARPGHRGDVPFVEVSEADALRGTPENPYRPIRVVLSVPVRRNAPRPELQSNGDDQWTSPAAGNRRDDAAFVSGFARRLAHGPLDTTMEWLDDASADQRAAAYRYIGELLRSASAAEAILDRLSPQDQVVVCGHWAREPAVRTVAFNRLRQWSAQAGVSDDVDRVVVRLARDPAMTPWLRNYQLNGDRRAKPNVSS